MKRVLFAVALGVVVLMTSCDDEASNDQIRNEDPSHVHPPEEAIPDSTTLLKDSVIVPKSAPGGDEGFKEGSTDDRN